MAGGEAARLAVRLGRALCRAPANGLRCTASPLRFQAFSLVHAAARTISSPWCLQSRMYASYPAHTLMQMPSLSPTMTQGNITVWKKKEGDQVAPGHVLAEVETDKATLDWEAQEDGYIAKILYPDGSKDIPVGTAVAVLVEEASEVAAFKNYSPGAASSSAPAPPAKPAPAAAAAPPPKGGSFPPHEILTMPSLSPTMSMGNILEWKKQVGDSVAPGELFCDVETDKATMGWEAQEEGFVAQILVPSGSKDLQVGTPLLVLVEDKESIPAFASYTSEHAKSGGAAPAPAAAAAPAAAPKPAAAAAPQAAAPPAAPSTSSSGDRIKASPLAKKLAAETGVSLEGIVGSGPGGRITVEDVQKAAASGRAAPAAAAAPRPTAAAPAAPAAAAAAAPGASFIDVAHSQIRRIIAARLLESKQTIPHYYLTVECQVDGMLKLREEINARAADKGSKISVNDFIIKAASLALKKVPGVNSSWQPDFTRQYNNVDISVAVQTPTGLLTPIVKDADKKGLAAISSDVRSLAAKAKEGKLQPAEFIGGTFTISNLGMYGVKQFAAIVNPPQAAILAVGSVDKKVVLAKSGQFEQVSALHVTLSCDHRVIDGAMGAEWLQAFRGYLENPFTMLL